MHNDRVAVVDVQATGVLKHDLLVNDPFVRGNLGRIALQRVVKLFRAAKESRCPLDHSPSGLDTERVQEERQRRQNLGDATPIEGRTNMYDMRAT